MPSYIWSGKDSSGTELTERVTAETPEEARDMLLRRGWSDLRRETSEIHEFVKREIEAVSDPNCRPSLTVEQEKAFLRGVAPGFWGNWRMTVSKSGGTLLILTALLGWSAYHRKIGAIVFLSTALLAFVVLYPALHFYFGRASRLFRQLHEARNWRRWNEVLACLDALRRVQRSRKMGIGEAEMARYRALALAGQGKLDEAISHFEQAANASTMPQWLRYSHLASIYTVAEKYDQAVECYRRALEHTTEKGTVCLDFGAYLVQRFNRPAEARKFLEIAEASALPDLAANHVLALRGLIAYREGNFAAANQSMSEALTGFEQRSQGRRYIFEPSILLAQGCLAAINAALGNKEAARAYFAKSEKYLATIRMDEWIREYRSRME